MSSDHISLHYLRAGELSQNQLDGEVDQQLEWQELGNILDEFWHECERHKLTGEQQDQCIIELMDRIDACGPEGERCDRSRQQKADQKSHDHGRDAQAKFR